MSGRGANDGCCGGSKQPEPDSCCSKPAADSCCSSGKTPAPAPASGGGCCGGKTPAPAPAAGGGCCSSKAIAPAPAAGGGCCGGGGGAALAGAPHVSVPIPDDGETFFFNVEGMTCAGCQLRIERHLATMSGVLQASVSLLTHKAEVTMAPGGSADYVQAEINSLGFKAERVSGGLASTVVLRLSCAAGAAESLVAPMAGVKRLSVKPGAAHSDVDIEYDPAVTGARTLRDAVSAAGVECDLSPLNGAGVADTTSARELAEIKGQFWRSMALAVPAFVVRYVLEGEVAAVDRDAVPGVTWATVLMLLLATPVQLVIASPIYSSAYSAVTKSGRLNMDVLISLSTTVAYGYSLISVAQSALAGEPRGDTMFEVSTMLVFLILLGRLLEKQAKQQTTRSVSQMMSMRAEHALLVSPDGLDDEQIDTALVQRGDILRVLPGSRVPTDGVILEGHTVVDESMVSGEAAHVAKAPGDHVIGATVNHHGLIVMRADHTVHESVLAHILQLVETAQAAKPEVQRVADAVAGKFTLCIVLLATTVFFVWWRRAATGGVDPGDQSPVVFALRFAIAVLVISCPCAISLAVPTAVMVASGVGAKRGVLVKGGPVLEQLARVSLVAFDKTGTLTGGAPGVTDAVAFAGARVTRDAPRLQRLWAALGGAERGSEHPVGKALVAAAEAALGAPPAAPSAFEAAPGRGCVATVDGAHVVAGTLLLLEDEDVELSDAQLDAVAQLEDGGNTVVVAARNGVALGAVALNDSLRAEAAGVVKALQNMGVQVWMLSGDMRRAAEDVAAEVGIWPNRVRAPVLPSDKLRIVTELQQQGQGERQTVMVVGDGVNDAPALAQADVGVAMGQGTQIACDAADVVLIRSDLADVLYSIALGRATMRRVRLNFAWGIAYNLLMMPLAAGAYYSLFHAAVPPAMAGLSELLSSVPVILFSLMLNGFAPPSFASGGVGGGSAGGAGGAGAGAAGASRAQQPATERSALLATSSV